MTTQLQTMQQSVYDNNVAHGWFDSDRPLSADIALLHSEVSEAYEAARKNNIRSFSDQGYDPSSFEAEIADIFIRLLDTCQRYDIDLELAFDDKMAFNRSRSYRHGNKAE